MIRVSRPTAKQWARLGWLVVSTFIILVPGISQDARGEKRTDRKTQTDARPRNTIADEKEIRRIIGQYAKSVDVADTTLASQIWSNSPEVSFIHPLGHEHGLEQ